MLETFDTNQPNEIYSVVKREGKLIRTITENKYSEQVWILGEREYHFDFIDNNKCTNVQFKTL